MALRRYENAPAELLDASGEGIYLRCEEGDRPRLRAAEIFECHWRRIRTETFSMIPVEFGDQWRPVSFRNWRWWLWPLTRQPAVYLLCFPAEQGRSEG